MHMRVCMMTIERRGYDHVYAGESWVHRMMYFITYSDACMTFFGGGGVGAVVDREAVCEVVLSSLREKKWGVLRILQFALCPRFA